MTRHLFVQPRTLLLLDGCGAVLSALLLGLLLPAYQPLFGMPSATLHLLAVFAAGFAGYSFGAAALGPYLRPRIAPGEPSLNPRLLRPIAVLNSSYCLLTLGLCLWHRAELTGLGWAYFLAEIGVVLVLVRLEIKVGWAR